MAAEVSDRILYEGASGIRVGSFRRYPWQTPFADTGPIGGFLLVFPRTAVVIQQAGSAPVVADPTRVMLYNRGQEYTRRALSERGDECEWFSLPPEMIADALRDDDPAVDDRLDRPFTRTHGNVDAASYLLQRRVVEHLESAARPDPLFVEEAISRLLALCGAPQQNGGTRRPSRTAHRELAEAARSVLSADLDQSLSLNEVATRVRASPFHLARVFRGQTGTTLHAFRQEVRLRSSLERLLAGEDLTRVALDHGFSSHSHFTASFRRLFGAPPSRLRTPPRGSPTFR